MSSMLITPPSAEPVALAEMKAFLRVEHDADDDVIAALTTGARTLVEARTRRALMTQGWRLTRDVWPAGGVLPLLPAPVAALLAVRVYRVDGGADLIDTSLFVLDTAAVPAVLTYARGALPAPGRPRGGIELDIEAGYGDDPEDVPEPLRQAIRLLTAHWYENRALVAASGEVASVPMSVAALLAPYRVVSL